MSGRRGGATKRRKSTHGGNNSQGGNQTGDRDEGIMDRFLRLRTRQGMGSGSGGPRSNQNASLVSGEQTNLNVSFHEEEHQANASQTLGDAVIVGLVNTVQDLKKEVRIAVEDLKREVGSLRSQNEEVVALLRQLRVLKKASLRRPQAVSRTKCQLPGRLSYKFRKNVKV